MTKQIRVGDSVMCMEVSRTLEQLGMYLGKVYTVERIMELRDPGPPDEKMTTVFVKGATGFFHPRIFKFYEGTEKSPEPDNEDYLEQRGANRQWFKALAKNSPETHNREVVFVDLPFIDEWQQEQIDLKGIVLH